MSKPWYYFCFFCTQNKFPSYRFSPDNENLFAYWRRACLNLLLFLLSSHCLLLWSLWSLLKQAMKRNAPMLFLAVLKCKRTSKSKLKFVFNKNFEYPFYSTLAYLITLFKCYQGYTKECHKIVLRMQ